MKLPIEYEMRITALNRKEAEKRFKEISKFTLKSCDYMIDNITEKTITDKIFTFKLSLWPKGMKEKLCKCLNGRKRKLNWV